MKSRWMFCLFISLVMAVLGLGRASAQSTLPQIASVKFSSGSPYQLAITGAGFGSAPPGVPCTSGCTIGYFRIGDNAQLGHGEWGYTGDGNVLTYESWSDTSIIVSGLEANAGDSINIALWNASTGIGATWGGNIPSATVQITGAELWGSGQNLYIDVHGSGFGSQPWTGNKGYSGDIFFFEFIDYRTHCGTSSSLFNAGGSRFGRGQDPTQLNYRQWSDSEILITGFGRGYGQGCATYQAGDPITVAVWQNNGTDTDGTGPQASFSGQGSTITGVVNAIYISSVNVTNSLPCNPANAGHSCFSIQQNFFVTTPNDVGGPSYWFQNGVQLAQVRDKWQARPDYCELYIPNGGEPLCQAKAWVGLSQGLPPILLKSRIGSDNMLLMTTSLGTGNEYPMPYPIPAGSFIVGAPAPQEATGGWNSVVGAILPYREPKLVLVGEYTQPHPPYDPSTATFSSPTSGYVISGLSVSGNVEQKPGSATPTTKHCANDAAESSAGLSWLVNQDDPARAGFSATGTGTEEGVIYVPAIVASGLSTCVE